MENELMSAIVEACANAAGVSERSIFGPSRKAECIAPRHAAMYLVATYSGRSLKTIGKFFNRDHTAIINARDSVRFSLSPSVAPSAKDLAVRKIVGEGIKVIPEDLLKAADNIDRSTKKAQFLAKSKHSRLTMGQRVILLEEDLKELRAIVMANGHANVLETINK